MQLTLPADGSVSLKGRVEQISLGNTVTLNGYTVPGRGEYDVAGVQCEVAAAGTSLVYFLRFEDLQITYLSQITPEVAKLDDAANCSVLVVDVRSEDTPESLKSILKVVEPSYVVLRGAGATEAFRLGLSIPQEQIGNFKLTRAGLPIEGTSILYS